MAYQTGTLTGHYFADLGGVPASGTVEVFPVADNKGAKVKQILDDAGNAILTGRVKVELDTTGAFSVDLPATDDPTLNPSGFGYIAVARLSHVHLPAVMFQLPGGTTVDVEDVTSVVPVEFEASWAAQAKESAAEALASETAAATSATDAAQSALTATGAATDAEAFEAGAETARAAAEIAQSEAAGSATDAATSATQAETFAAGTVALQDEAVSTLIDTPAAGPLTQAALSASYARRTVINALDHGVVADGVTDDSAAWNALVAASAAGTVLTWTGRSMLDSYIQWKSGVSLVGQGWGRSVLATRDTTGTEYFSAIQGKSGDGFSTTNTLDDCIFRDFEIDGSGLTGTVYSIGGKGIYAQFMRRCQFRNLYIHDTVATGLGIDFLPDCLIDGVLTERTGRLWNGAAGGAGIGIGTGAWEEEPLIISNCIAKDGGNWGIFIEKQSDQPYYAKGIVITGCVAMGNRVGFNDSGGDGAKFIGCTSTDNTEDGFSLRYDARNGIATACTFLDNGSNGVYIPPEVHTGGYTIESCAIGRNGGRGVYIDGHLDGMNGLAIRDCDIFENAFQGIYGEENSAGTPLTDLLLEGNRIRANGQDGGGTSRGVKFDAHLTGLVCRNNEVYDRQAVKTQVVGMEFSTVSTYVLTESVIEGNNFHDNGAVDFRFQAQTVTDTLVRNNRGYVTEASGSDTIADVATTQVVTHGLAATPATVTLTPRGGELVWVSDRTTTTFTVSRVGSTGALVFDWRASV